jgi:DNA-binding beta-propeller fold protein YncE
LKFSSTGVLSGTFAAAGVILPVPIAIDGTGNEWVGNWGPSSNGMPGSVTKLSSTGSFISNVIVTLASGFNAMPTALAIDGSGNVWFTNGVSAASSGVLTGSVIELNSTGTVLRTLLVNSPANLAIDGSGNVWVSNVGSGNNYGIPGTSSTNSNVLKFSPAGTLLGTFVAGPLPGAMAIDGSGNVWVVAGLGNVVNELSPTGALLGAFTVGANPLAIAIDGSGNVWVANSGNGTIGTALGDSNVTELIGVASPVKVPLLPLVRPAKYAYVANYGANTVSQYTITGGLLSPMSTATVATGTNPISVTVDPTGQYAYVANYIASTVSQYTIGAGGLLSPMSTATVTAGTNPRSVTVDPTGQYAYVANTGARTVSQYTIGAGGLLSPMSTATVATGTSPMSVTVDPTGQYAYVANYGANTVSQYTIGAGGLLSPMPTATVTAGTNPRSVTVDPTGQYAYVANYGASTVSQYTISAGGALTANGAAAAGSGPASIVTAP